MYTVIHMPEGSIEYRSVGKGPTILILNGGHTHCHSPLGDESFFLEQGYQLLIPSRPGYGKTPSSTGRKAEQFADALIHLLDQLDLKQVIVVGISGGGPTALQFAGRYPERVNKLILQNAVTGLPFPVGMTRLMTYLGFNPWVERWTWSLFRHFAKHNPLGALSLLMKSLSLLPDEQVLAKMSNEQQQQALALLLASRSGSGFLHDIHHYCGDLQRVRAPTLIITSKYDGAVSSAHATYAMEHIPNAESFTSEAESHLLWFSDHVKTMRAKMREFLLS